jgi:tRNA threonylcarbamoyladenosine biosynthesis protein TsaE
VSEKSQISPNGPVASVLAEVSTAAEMRALGRSLASVLRPGDLVILSGGLGAGKTTLTQGIGDGLGVRGPITSPTFVIARVHPPLGGGGRPGAAGRGPALVHADAYRLGSALELDDLDLDTDTASSVTVVEWGEGLAEGLSADRLEITITPEAPPAPEAPEAVADPDDAAGDVPRRVRVYAVGERWEGINLPLACLADRL